VTPKKGANFSVIPGQIPPFQLQGCNGDFDFEEGKFIRERALPGDLRPPIRVEKFKLKKMDCESVSGFGPST